MDSMPEFGRFVPLLGLGTEQPPPKRLSFARRNGITLITNAPAIREPASTPVNRSLTDRTPASRASIHVPVIPALTTPMVDDSASSDAGDTTDDEEWYLEDLDVLRRASRPSAPAHISSTSNSQKPSQTTGQGLVHDRSPVAAEHPLASDEVIAPAPVVDHNETLLRASMPSPDDDAGMARFLAERKRIRAKKQQQVEKCALRKGSTGREVPAAPRSSFPMRRDLEKTSHHPDFTASTTITPKVAATPLTGVGKKKQSRDELKARAAAGDEDAATQLENLRASGRAYRQQQRTKAADGDAEATAKVQKQRDQTNAWRKNTVMKAKKGDDTAKAKIQKYRKQSQAWAKDVRTKASMGDAEAIARVAKQKEQNKARHIGIQQRAAQGDAEAILILQKESEQKRAWQKQHRAQGSVGG